MDTRAEWDTTGCVPKGKDGARPKRYNLKVKIDVGFWGPQSSCLLRYSRICPLGYALSEAIPPLEFYWINVNHNKVEFKFLLGL